MVFTLQMMLILVLGHALALSKPAAAFLDLCLVWCRNSASAAAMVALVALLAAYINWGLGLIMGAVFARKVAEKATREGISINYPLVGAAGYAGLMVWHGGLSGSAPLSVNSPDHNLIDTVGLIPIQETIFSGMNLSVTLAMLISLPLLAYFLGKKSRAKIPQVSARQVEHVDEGNIAWAEKIDHGFFPALLLGGLMLFLAFYHVNFVNLDWLTLNWIIQFFFGVALCFHRSVFRFVAAVDEAIVGAAGIAIQFPLYFGIMAIMKDTGLITQQATAGSFPILTLLSAGLVNILVPSGGGQWQVQGELVVQVARDLGVPVWKAVMALSYGDQLTNMLQPFWALPLLGITGLKAKEILPYTLVFMGLGLHSGYQ
jgi:short-chain fatty acids transporter